MEAVKGLEDEPEKGRRCEVCFDKRFDVSAKKALELGEKKITTTLLVSPLKSQEQLKKSGDAFYENFGVVFFGVVYRAKGGTQDQSRVTKEEQLYRQDYCGCIYGLSIQREQQNRLIDEMFSPISGQTLPASIEERLEIYRYRIQLEDKNIEYKIIKQKFLNYRQFSLKVTEGKTTAIPAYALSYSTLPRKKVQGNRVHEEVKLITLDEFNMASKLEYKNIKELIYNPPSFEEELSIRCHINQGIYDLTPIIVIQNIPTSKLTIELDAKTYEDTKEKLIII